MNFRTLILSAIFLLTGVLNAQTEFRPGYVLTSENDTLFGEIDYRSDDILGRFCKFKGKLNGTQIEYSPSQIFGFRFNEGRYFVSKEVKGIKAFLEILVRGKITIYYLRDDKGDRFFIEKNSTDFSELPYYEQYNMEDGKEYLFKSRIHLNILNFYMQDAPSLISKINKLGKPEQNNLIELGEDYNSLFKNKVDANEYKKKLASPKLELEISGGLVYFYDLNGISNKTSFVPGLVAYIWLPLTNERLYFRTGVIFCNFGSKAKNIYNYRIPIVVEYRYPKGIIRPILGLGLNIYATPAYQTIAFRGGVNIKLHRLASLAIAYDIDFNPKRDFPLFPESLATQTFSTGLRINFK